MAEQAYILDIDTKFLKNLEIADKSISKTVQQVDRLTESFNQTLTRSGKFASQMQKIYTDLATVGNVDFSTGMAKIDTTARTSIDAVNLLMHNISKLKQEYNDMATSFNGQKSRGTHLRVTSDADMENVAKLKKAIEQINSSLRKNRKEPLSLIETESLNRQKNLYQRAIQELLSTDKDRTKRAVNEANKRIRAIREEMRMSQEMIDRQHMSSPAAAISYAREAKSVAEMSKALQYLKTVRDGIDSSTKAGIKDIERINSLIGVINRRMESLRGSASKFGAEMSIIKQTSGKLSGLLGSVFGINAIRGYINQIVKVRGEFELQQKALRAIIQDTDTADKIWGQTTQLALKSPFQVKELVTYTKQLAAYRVETEKLHDTTKMLADISAGLGVDMGRLILAFGQVKAANYLRGTELRQFSEAGINILGELSKYFSELEGRAISVGEVFEMVSKRLVSFSDVEEVLHRVTSEGGVFYDMQAKQANTVKGMVSNLKDALDIMLNEISKDSEGSIKSILEATRRLASNWKELFFSIKAVGMSFIALKSATAIYSLGMRNAAKSNLWFNSSLKQGIGTTLESIKALKWSEAAVLGVTKAQYLMGKATMFAQGALRGLGTILIAILPVAAITAVVEIVRRMTEAKRLSEELKSDLQGIILDGTSALDKNIAAYKDLIERLKTANEGSNERREIIHKLNNEYGQYLDFTVTEATTVDALASSYDNLVSRMKEKASLATYEKGVQEIVNSYGEKLKDAQEGFFDAFKVGLGSAPILNAENSGLIPKKEEVQQLLNLIRQAVNETNDDIESSAKLVNDVISKYYGDGYKLEAGRMDEVAKYVDLMIEQKSKEKELQSQINEYYGKTLKSREANIALQKLENEYALKQKKIKEESNLSDFEVRQKMSELQDEFEENKIKLYFEFGEISEEEKNRQIDSIKKWATTTVKSINESIKNDLGGIFSQEDLSKVLFTRDMQESKSISEYLQSISDSWSNQTNIIKEQISLKSAGVAIDEEALAKAVKMERLYRSVASLLGIDLDYTEQISEQMRESINLNLPEEFHISLEQAYMGMDKLISTTEDKEKSLLNTINQINEQKREGLDYDEERLKQLEEEYFWTKRLLDLISPTTNDPIDKTKVSFINSKLQQEYQLSTVDATKDEVTLLKEANDERDKAIAYEAQIKAMKEMGVPITEDELNNAKNEVEQLSLKAKLLGYEEKEKKSKSGGSRENSLYDERIKVIDDLNKKYKELNKTLSVSESLQGAFDAYIDAFAEAYNGVSWMPSNVKGMSVNEFITKVLNFPDEDSIVAFFDQLAEEPMKAFERIKVELAKGEYVYDIKIRNKQQADEDIKKQVENLFSGYELSIELGKLNIPSDLAREFFNIDAISFDELRAKLKSMKPQFIGRDMELEYEKYLKKIDELEDKAQQERLKKYVKYLVAGQGERVKIKLDEMRQIAEIESLPFDDAQKELAREAVRAEANKRIEKLDWEEFKDSGMYVRLFEDLEFASSRTLKLMREKLIELKSQLSDLDADDLKHLYDQIEKLDNELVERNPYKALAESADEYFKSLKRLKEAEAELSHAEEVEKGLASRVSDVDVKLSKEKSVYEQMSKSKDATSEDLNKQREKIEALNAQLVMLKAQLLAQGKLTADLENEIDALTKTRKMFTGSAEEIGRDISEAANALPQVAGHLENVFGTMSDGTRDTLDSIATIGGGIGDAIAGFASNNPVQAIMGIAQAIGGIFAIGDKAKERKIQRELKHVDELDKRYQEIDEALDRMYNSRQMAAYTKELNDNIDSQIDSYERMRALEEDKKKSDQAKIDEYNQSIEDLNKRRKEMFAEQQSKATGGILDDAISAAEGFVDAWYDAFQETGDGLSGLESNFKEMLTNLIKKQAAMQIVGNFTEKYSNWLKEAINTGTGDVELTAEEARAWAEKVQATFPELSTLLENFFSGTQDLLQEQGELSELSKGIQGVTESTAQVLEALLNSMRFYVADSNIQLKNIANALISNDVEANPLLNELRQQTAMIRSIESMFDSVIGRGDSIHSGAYLKVSM